MPRTRGTATADDTTLAAITRAILEVAQPNRIVLFGSRARGDATEWSDYDIFVEIDDDPSCARVMRAALFQRGLSAELLANTPASFAVRKHDPGTLEYQVERDGRVLYARPNAGGSESAHSHVREPVPAPWPSIAEWRRKADRDLIAAEQLLAADNPIWDVVCFLAHDAVEKYLKTVIVAMNAAPPHKHALHDLLALTSEPLRSDPQMGSACHLLEKLWPETRYPSQREPGPLDATAAVDAARIVRRIILPDAGEPVAGPG